MSTIDGTGTDTGADNTVSPQQAAHAKRWETKIKDTIQFDKAALQKIADCRAFAVGDTTSKVASNLCGTYVDITTDYLFARNPAVDIAPALNTEPPDKESIRAAVMAGQIPPEVQAQAQQAQMLASQAPPIPGPDGMPVTIDPMQAAQAILDQHIEAQFQAIQNRYHEKQRTNKGFANTSEIIVTSQWKTAALKRAGKPFVRSAVTTGVGAFKSTWQERTAPDPETTTQLNDLREALARVKAQREKLAEGESGADYEADEAQYQAQIADLEGKLDRVVARGMVADFVPVELVVVSPEVDIDNYQNAAWIACGSYVRKEEVCTHFPDVPKDRFGGAISYTRRKKPTEQLENPLLEPRTSDDAYEFTSGAETGKSNAIYSDGDGGNYVRCWEVWSRDEATVYTLVEGVRGWVKQPFKPPQTERFYSIFILCLTPVDAGRWPQSAVERSRKLFAERDRIMNAEGEHRKRTIPKSVFDETNLNPKDAQKVADGTTAEMIGVSPTVPGTDVRTMIAPIQYPVLDPALYDRSRIDYDLEKIWGIQDALAGSVQTAKTATEADIQQGGFNTRMSARRDALDDVLTEYAFYTLEILREKMDATDAVAIAGPDAIWPEYHPQEVLREMLSVDIRAGSSGKPDTVREREAWANGLLPFLVAQIDKVGQLRNSPPDSIADCHERLTQMTVEKFGERLDINSIMPILGPPPMALPPGEGNV